MSLIGSLILVALGAILYWGVTASVAGVSVNTIGVILMVVGAIGGFVSLVYLSGWGGSRARTADDERTVIPR